jgi:hypothetical protein
VGSKQYDARGVCSELRNTARNIRLAVNVAIIVRLDENDDHSRAKTVSVAFNKKVRPREMTMSTLKSGQRKTSTKLFRVHSPSSFTVSMLEGMTSSRGHKSFTALSRDGFNVAKLVK